MPRVSVVSALVVFSVATSSVALAETFTLSPGDDYSKLEAAGPGDIVEVEPGTYQFRVYLSAIGTEAAPIIIRAADPANRPVWDLDGMNVESWPGSYTGGDNGRGCWQVTGSHYEISGIVFKNCRTGSGNAPGIRANAAESLLVRDVLFQDNDAGFSGAGEDVVVEFSEFDGNGRVSNPPQHSNYIFGGSFTLRHSYVHDSVGGQNFHIRARESVLEYNWFARAANYEGDIMTGSDASHSMLFRGNVVLGNPSPGNGSTVITLYNDQGAPGITMDLTVVWNTFVLQSGTNPAVVSVRNDTLDSASVVVSNNIVVGTNKAFSIADTGTANYTLSGTNNWFESGADVGPLVATLFGNDPGFVDAGSLAFFPGAGSPAIGAADAGVADGPDREYFENEVNPMKFRWRASMNDIGAFESTTMGNGYGPYDDPGEPPPTSGAGGGGATGGASSAGGNGSGAGSGTGASATGGSNQGADSDADSGCGCRTAGKPSARGAWLLLLLCAGIVSARRREAGELRSKVLGTFR